MRLDHLILPVNDLEATLAYYCDVLGFTRSGEEGPFQVIRCAEDFVMLLSPFGTEGGTHLAFVLDKPEFDIAFARIKSSGVAYGSHYHDTTNMADPAPEFGARGATMSLYLNDPNNHLIELLYYGD